MSRKILTTLFLLSFVFSLFISAELEIYFSPKGGFSPNNNHRMVTLKDGRTVHADLNNALIEMIENTKEGSTIKIAMYAFGYRPVLDVLVDAAKTRNIKVKLILDSIADWTREMHKEVRDRIAAEHESAKQENRVFDFQLKEILPQAMVDRGRWKKIQNDVIIYGTMHEKFGIFFEKDSKIPLHGFCGSANISWSAGEVFAENRVFFKNEPSMGRQLAEEFARLWNEFGTELTKNCQSEIFLPAQTYLGDVQIISNAKPLDEENWQRIDKVLLDLMEQVNPQNGTLDVAIFSFTHTGLAEKLLELAERYPNIKVRILMDQTQMVGTDNHQGVLGPYMEKAAEFKNLKNFEIRYKWRANIYAWDPQLQKCELIHWRNLLLHHKCLVVNGKRMGLGSYNWSTSAEFRNFENVMVFFGEVPEHQKIIRRFMDEFEFIWNSPRPQGKLKEKIVVPQVISGPKGRELKQIIVTVYEDPDCKKIMEILDTNPDGCKESSLLKSTGLTTEVLREKTDKLEKATLIFSRVEGEENLYQLAD